MDSGSPARFPGTRNEHQPNFGGRLINENANRKNGAVVMSANIVHFSLPVKLRAKSLGLSNSAPKEIEDSSLRKFGGVNTILLRSASDGQCSTGRSRL